MNKAIKIIAICLILFQNAKATDYTNFKIKFPSEINVNHVKVLFDDGLEQNFIDLLFSENVTIVKRKLLATHATLSILYQGENNTLYSLRLLINSKSGFVIFKHRHPTQKPLANYILKNATDVFKCKEYLDLKRYCKHEFEAEDTFTKKYNLVKNDTNLINLNNSSIKSALKALEYIKIKGKRYFYFWYFRINIVKVLLKTNQIELYETFNTAFPEKYKESFEGKNLKSLIAGNIFIKNGMVSPSFNANDYRGNNISSEMLKGKYILLSFWASWCGPCIAEIPLLKKIRKDYSVEELELISVSYDTDSMAFIKSINSLEMNWTNLFSTNNLRNLFGDKPIPSLYLFDQNGMIAFSSWEDEIDNLHKILETKLKR